MPSDRFPLPVRWSVVPSARRADGSASAPWLVVGLAMDGGCGWDGIGFVDGQGSTSGAKPLRATWRKHRRFMGPPPVFSRVFGFGFEKFGLKIIRSSSKIMHQNQGGGRLYGGWD